MRGAAQIQLLEPANDSEVGFPVVLRWEEEPEVGILQNLYFPESGDDSSR